MISLAMKSSNLHYLLSLSLLNADNCFAFAVRPLEAGLITGKRDKSAQI